MIFDNTSRALRKRKLLKRDDEKEMTVERDGWKIGSPQIKRLIWITSANCKFAQPKPWL
jgi:hypothetical protein